MDSIGADYTFKSYPNAKHAFTNPNADAVDNKYHIGVGYNREADKQSWEAMKEFLQKLFGKQFDHSFQTVLIKASSFLLKKLFVLASLLPLQ